MTAIKKSSTGFTLKAGHREILMTSSLTREELEQWPAYPQGYPLRELFICETLDSINLILSEGIKVAAVDLDNLIDFCQVLASCYKEITKIDENIVIYGVLKEGKTKDKVDAAVSKALQKSETSQDLLLQKVKLKRPSVYNESIMFLLYSFLSLERVNREVGELNRRKKEQKAKESELEKRERVLEKKEEKRGSFRRSGHLADLMLRYDYPPNKKPALFSVLKSTTLQDIEIAGVECSEVVEGIKLTPSETKMIDCLCKLLDEKSQKYEPGEPNYYTGNLNPDVAIYGFQSPKLSFSLYEITKEYKGGDNPSGKDIANVRQVLTELNNRKFCIKYTETTKGTKNEWIKKEYEKFTSIIDLDLATLSYGVGSVERYKESKTVVVLHPVFKRQIDSKFITSPSDLLRRTILAYGSHNVSEITLKLRDVLLRAASGKHYTYEIKLDKLYWQLAEKWMQASRKSMVEKYTVKAFQTMIALGLLESYKIEPSKTTGEPKVICVINKNFE
jgi:hypothetical protein